ncbi:hypothetical protein CAQU_00875 [Corynebacterium aquilae DSM 44791]|uniref:Endonuclease III n=1 Tax=Corynebacterium aquilae DSM 44791 TaxID=1431546 RepID=A0A1L7CDE2_9CORY|nr:hypothetical protein CAQU_00875 [Corynebacterium aquilae DSM 44791]
MLAQAYPEATCELNFTNPFELLVATALSAQTTDVRVNTVTPELFSRFPDADALAHASHDEVAEIIRPVGMHNQKAKNLINMASSLVGSCDGQVPADRDSLTALAGVGRKTANVVLGTWFRQPTMPVDTHVTRVAHALGLSRGKTPLAIEKDLCAQLPEDTWVDFSHRMILHGRRICHARTPDCGNCILSRVCPSATAPLRG